MKEKVEYRKNKSTYGPQEKKQRNIEKMPKKKKKKKKTPNTRSHHNAKP